MHVSTDYNPQEKDFQGAWVLEVPPACARATLESHALIR